MVGRLVGPGETDNMGEIGETGSFLCRTLRGGAKWIHSVGMLTDRTVLVVSRRLSWVHLGHEGDKGGVPGQIFIRSAVG